MDQYQQYIHTSRYARWREEDGRRETWEETVDRLIGFYLKRFPQLSSMLTDVVRPAILHIEVMPSMRSLMTAGPALERENIAAYNCYYHAINDYNKLAETLYILMCGTGVGFSCEHDEVSKMPVVPVSLTANNVAGFPIGDSKEGWAWAFKHLLTSVYEHGHIPSFDYSGIRPAGARLHTFGGRASGPAPLRRLIDFTVDVLKKAQGRKLTSIEVHDIMCMIGEVVVVGGVRRSALISLSDLSDNEMRNAKAGAWWDTAPWRSLANNSAVYTHKPNAEVFLEEWLSLVKSKSGERGIFNREAATRQAVSVGRSPDHSYGCNPCSEIILRDGQFCNLTEVIVRPDDNSTSLAKKVRVASILGTLQSTLTDFNFVNENVRKNTEEERLLGVSLTGIYDNALLRGDDGIYTLQDTLKMLRGVAKETNDKLARQLGINPSAAITCVKPSGTVSQLCNTASGLHPRHSEYYLRTTRLDKKDPLYALLKDQGVYMEDDQFRPNDTAVIYWPQRAEGSTTRAQVSAIEHLELWLTYQIYWCDHKPSVTINVKDHEWPAVGAWVYKHFDECSGISFLPYSEHTYVQAPYQEMEKEAFDLWIAENPQPVIDWSALKNYEKDDNTTGTQEYACVGGQCELN